MKLVATLCCALVLLTVGPVWAGGSGLNVIVVVNQNSTNSLQLGNDYCQLRGVPPGNVWRLTNWTGGSVTWSRSQFTNQLLNPLLAMIAGRGLTNQAQFILLSMDIPYRVSEGSGQNSTTSALFYGFKTNGAPVAGLASCSLPDPSSNSYAYSEMPFSLAPPDTAPTNAFLAMMLTDTNLAGAENTLRRGVVSDGSRPTQTVYLEETGDTDRNVRYWEFDNSVFENQVIGNLAVTRLNSNNTVFTNLAGLQTGFANLSLATNEFLPGAIADNLTSLGGYILESSGQTPLIAFLEAGAAGSYGTVVEPCNYTQKFPDPVDYFYQTRGFALAEAYYQSVLNPFEGLVVGEPLSAPFARPGTVVSSSLTNGAVLSGLSPLRFGFTAAATNRPLAQADLFVDGVLFATMTNLPPAPGNVVSVTLKGTPFAYTVQPNDTLATVAEGLAAVLDEQTNETQVMAQPVGDRIELQSQAVYVPGSNVTVSAGSVPGSASALTTGLTAARPACLDTVATAYQVIRVSLADNAPTNAPVPGDWLQLNIIKTNGVSVTLGVTNTTAGTSLNTLVGNLLSQMAATPALNSTDGVVAADYDNYNNGTLIQFSLFARVPGLPASQILVTLTSSTNLEVTPSESTPLTHNLSDLLPRDHLYVSSGLNSLSVNFPCDTTSLADGWHQFTAAAYEGTSVRTQTRAVYNVQIQNTGLTATLAVGSLATNTGPYQPVQFLVTAGVTNVARIELFSTGGSLGVITNQPSAGFTVYPTNLGWGWHPFYAVVTDSAGERYQTAPIPLLFPLITLTLAGAPPTLTWPAALDHQYAVQATTNLAAGFQTVATLTATNNGNLQWPVTESGQAGFYRVQLGN